MQTIKHSLVVIIAFGITGCATTGDGSTWSCSANDIKSYGYNGSDIAYIHLGRYARGNTYQVVKSADGKTATGVTGDGTPFTCTRTN